MKEFTTFEALLKPLTSNLIEESIRRFDADYYCKTFRTWDHLIAMIYAQLHEMKSLRDIEIGFNSQTKLKAAIQCTEVNRSTLSDANCRRPAGCFLWIAERLMALLPRKARKEVNKVVKKIDSSPIQLKGKGFDEWTLANRTLRCQGLKLHVEYDGQLDIPTKVNISHANVDDCRMGQRWPILRDTIYVFDKGYYDFKNKSPRGGKKNLYNKPLRRIVVKREGKERPLVLVSNLVELPGEVIAELYKERWGIELFFKWIKQNLRIKKFLGRSENAVKTQIAVALIVYLLMGILKFVCKSSMSLHQLLVWIRHNMGIKKSIYRTIKPPEYDFPKKACLLHISGG
jgi:IS4 transposase